MSRRLAVRFVVGLFIIAAALFAYQFLRQASVDIDLPPTADTVGYLAALMQRPDGSQVVLIKPDGKIIPSPGYVAGATDRKPVWRPDGNRLFFTSDRRDKTFNVYRWNPASNNVHQRSVGTRAKSDPLFGPPGFADANKDALVIAGGFVLNFNPRDGSTRQLLPPVAGTQTQGSEGGVASQFESAYQQLGQAFRAAMWGKDRRFLIAIMQRETGDEVLIVQDMQERPNLEGGVRLPPPIPVLAANRIDFDVAADGKVVVAQLGYRFVSPDRVPPEFIKNGRPVAPYRNGVVFFDPAAPEDAVSPIVLTRDDRVGFAGVRVSPKGGEFLLVAGVPQSIGLEPRELAVLPLERGAGSRGRELVTGSIYEPSWDPSGKRIVFVMRKSGEKRSVYSVKSDGSDLKNLTGNLGDFSSPAFSPQEPKQP